MAALPTLAALLLTVRVALAALLVLLALAGLLLLLLLLLFLLVLVLLSALILLITHGTLLVVGVSSRKRGGHLHSSSLKPRIILTTFCTAFLAFAAKAEDRLCPGPALGTFETTAVTDARSFTLKDGREILLAGIEMPSGDTVTLEQLLAGGKVVLRQADVAGDRYGRIPAHVYVAHEGKELWVQQELLAAGLAQVGNRSGSCAPAMRAAEAPARRNRVGIWTNSAYGIMASDDLSGLAARQGRFTVAEGKVLSVRESAGTIYINFGRVWSRNLTVTILRRNKAAFEAAGIDPKKLEGARIRVRGWVEMRNGPRIDAARPEQVEVAAQD